MSSSVTYSSTRGGQTGLDFRSVVVQGLAHDRGLFVPDTIPIVTMEDLEKWRSLSFPDLAVQVIAKFVKDDQVPYEKLRDIVHRSCAAFRDRDVTPLKHVGGHAMLVCRSGFRIIFARLVVLKPERERAGLDTAKMFFRLTSFIPVTNNWPFFTNKPRSSFTVRLLLSRTLLSRCLAIFSSTFSKPDPTRVALLFWVPRRVIRVLLLLLAFVANKAFTASFSSPITEFLRFKSVR